MTRRTIASDGGFSGEEEYDNSDFCSLTIPEQLCLLCMYDRGILKIHVNRQVYIHALYVAVIGELLIQNDITLAISNNNNNNSTTTTTAKMLQFKFAEDEITRLQREEEEEQLKHRRRQQTDEDELLVFDDHATINNNNNQGVHTKRRHDERPHANEEEDEEDHYYNEEEEEEVEQSFSLSKAKKNTSVRSGKYGKSNSPSSPTREELKRNKKQKKERLKQQRLQKKQEEEEFFNPNLIMVNESEMNFFLRRLSCSFVCKGVNSSPNINTSSPSDTRKNTLFPPSFILGDNPFPIMVDNILDMIKQVGKYSSTIIPNIEGHVALLLSKSGVVQYKRSSWLGTCLCPITQKHVKTSLKRYVMDMIRFYSTPQEKSIDKRGFILLTCLNICDSVLSRDVINKYVVNTLMPTSSGSDTSNHRSANAHQGHYLEAQIQMEQERLRKQARTIVLNGPVDHPGDPFYLIFNSLI